MIPGLVRWLDERTGVPSALRAFLFEEIPASSGWPQVLGSVLLFLFLTQAFTGVLLALNFAPTAGEAYSSLNYILRDVSGGRMIRGLHHWGASMIVVVVAIHMAQVFLYGAYKRPRETTWIVGVVLLLITLAFGLTGYLLPWDNRAYWGTVVSTQIAGQAPVLGGYVQRLMGAENGVGAVTFARFYAAHTLLLPALALSLIGFHVYLVRKHGVTPDPLDVRPKRTFYPSQALKDTAAVFAAFVVLFTLAAAVQAPLDRMADPTDTTSIPRPDWYFLFLFQTLKFFKGAAEPIGSVLLPTIAVAVLFAVPFLDRSGARRIQQRTVAIGIASVALIGWASLTTAAVVTTPKAEANSIPTLASSRWLQLGPEEIAGAGYFRQARCSTCHNLIDGEPKPGPNLAELGTLKSTYQMIAHIRNPAALNPGTRMPRIELTQVQVQALSAFLLKLTPDNADAFSQAPEEAVAGAAVFVSTGCQSCHQVNGSGGTLGPPLNGLAARRSRQWVAQHLRDPKSQTPGTAMPAFQFADRDRDLVIAYLFALPGKQE
jgi:ubiquinol-cytochrome c reductase cytochrome b subunit